MCRHMTSIMFVYMYSYIFTLVHGYICALSLVTYYMLVSKLYQCVLKLCVALFSQCACTLCQIAMTKVIILILDLSTYTYFIKIEIME